MKNTETDWTTEKSIVRAIATEIAKRVRVRPELIAAKQKLNEMQQEFNRMIREAVDEANDRI